MKYDLHSHTIFSDGELTPEELLATAKENGVNVLAVTDHDTLDGLGRAQVAADKEQITLIRGVEISTRWHSNDIHILGLGVDVNNAVLTNGLNRHQLERVERAKKIAIKLDKVGIEGTWEEVCETAETHYVGRPDFARVLIKRGIVTSFQQAFSKYLAVGKPAYVMTEWASVKEAVEWINCAGGVAVVAHPGRYRMTRTKLCALLADFKSYGGAGMEVLNAGLDKNKTRDMAQLSRKYGLNASAGSDFHGFSYPGMRIGALAAMPEGCTPLWESELWAKCL